jgi:pimeloyl-ACP methyl ester carboxylesterase
MSIHPSTRRLPAVIASVLLFIAAFTGLIGGASADAHGGPSTPKPTIVLVHGAFADASGWDGVIERLQARATR